MMSALFFAGSVAILFLEGWCIARLLVRDAAARIAFALPLAALGNALVFFVFTVLGIPLQASFLWLAHAILTGLLLLIGRFAPRPAAAAWHAPVPFTPLTIMCLLVIGGALVYGFAHSAILSAFQYDSLTNWAMRSKVSFFAQQLVFDDPVALPLIRKPHYPFLVHALQLMAHAGQESWHDQNAAIITFLLSCSLLLSIFFVQRKLTGSTGALLSIMLLVGIPLFGVHLGEGYADHLLAEFGALALALLALARMHPGWQMFCLSALFASAAAWTKAEGLFFVLLPWAGAAFLAARWKDARAAFLTALFAAGPWPLFLLVRGYGFTPHGAADMTIGYQPGALAAAISVMLTGGSFGVFWPLLLLALLILAYGAWRRSHDIDRSSLILLLPGLLATAIVLGIYLFTPNAAYLFNGESFDRQLLTPSAMLIVGVILSVSPLMRR